MGSSWVIMSSQDYYDVHSPKLRFSWSQKAKCSIWNSFPVSAKAPACGYFKSVTLMPETNTRKYTGFGKKIH